MVAIQILPQSEFQRVRGASIDRHERLALLADMCRVNTLSAIKRAGSGHLGSSFSAMDIVVYLYECEMNTLRVGIDSPERDLYFSSKGHDVPGLYAVLHSHGILPTEKLLKLRRLGGLDGHPNVEAPGIEANTGSLGMGISKARGMAWAKRRRGLGGQVFVMTGDGELQEGQNFEALQTTLQQRVGALTVVVDHNRVQTDRLVQDIVDLGNLDAKLRAFGWHVVRCSGHDFTQLESAFTALRAVQDRPRILVAETIKGRGISFMEPAETMAQGRLYRWHSGAPDDASFEAGFAELVERIDKRLAAVGLEPLSFEDATPPPKTSSLVAPEYVADGYGEALVEIARERPEIVVLDADLAADCRVRGFETEFPERFIENGIAEQDMVSMAGGLARQGLLPVVNSFASFLASRANEQIYNNAGEGSRVVYAFHYAGLIPAGPGRSHQSLRDLSLVGALPNCVVLQPATKAEARMAVRWAVEEARDSVVLRLVIGPSPRRFELPEGYVLSHGRGAALTDGGDAVLFAYGPVMLHEALVAAELLAQQGFGLQVVNMPWLNRFDPDFLHRVVVPAHEVFVLEDHHPVGGLGDRLLHELVSLGLLGGRRFEIFAIEGYPRCGTPGEVLAYHRLDGVSLAGRIAAGKTVQRDAALTQYSDEAPQ